MVEKEKRRRRIEKMQNINQQVGELQKIITLRLKRRRKWRRNN